MGQVSTGRRSPPPEIARFLQEVKRLLQAGQSLFRREWAALTGSHGSVTDHVVIQGVVHTRRMFVLFEMDHGQRLATYPRKEEALAALKRVQESDPDDLAAYGIQEFRNGAPIGDYITVSDTAVHLQHS